METTMTMTSKSTLTLETFPNTCLMFVMKYLELHDWVVLMQLNNKMLSTVKDLIHNFLIFRDQRLLNVILDKVSLVTLDTIGPYSKEIGRFIDYYAQANIDFDSRNDYCEQGLTIPNDKYIGLVMWTIQSKKKSQLKTLLVHMPVYPEFDVSRVLMAAWTTAALQGWYSISQLVLEFAKKKESLQFPINRIAQGCQYACGNGHLKWLKAFLECNQESVETLTGWWWGWIIIASFSHPKTLSFLMNFLDITDRLRIVEFNWEMIPLDRTTSLKILAKHGVFDRLPHCGLIRRAIVCYSCATVEILLSSCSDVTKAKFDFRELLKLACKSESITKVKTILKYGQIAPTYEAILTAIGPMKTLSIAILLLSDPRIDITSGGINDYLFYAIENDNHCVTKFLIDHPRVAQTVDIKRVWNSVVDRNCVYMYNICMTNEYFKKYDNSVNCQTFSRKRKRKDD